MPATARIPLAKWDGPAGRSFIQSCKWNELLQQFIVAQADDVKGQGGIQDTVFRTHDRTMAYTGTMCTVDRGGHGSSSGHFNDRGVPHILLWHEHLDSLVRFPIVDGPAVPTRIKTPFRGSAVACSQKHDLLCLKKGFTYVGYTLSSVLAGRPQQLFRTVVQGGWYERFQGHHITKVGGKITLIIHGDNGTKKHSEMRLLTIVSSSSWRVLDTIDTTRMGDEAEGCTDYHDRIWVCKRSGGLGADRVVCLTPTKHLTSVLGTYVVAHTAKGYMWARQKGHDNRKRNEGFRITTGTHIEQLTFPDVPGREPFVVTEKGWAYRLKALQRV